MERITEPELMDAEEQALAYYEADFEVPHSNFIAMFQEIFHDRKISGYVLDLGCGPGDITFRFARAYPDCIVHGIDGSGHMLHYGRKNLERSYDLKDRIKFLRRMIPNGDFPREKYDIIISNSLLHHLHNPYVLWDTVKKYATPGALIFMMDLRRPQTLDEARQLVKKHAVKEPEILQHDFYHSLLAAFHVEEIRLQLETALLSHFVLKEMGDRHVVISGTL